ncbi:hypothetical protein H6P81_013450 [Aristolochia fimbriata]|uniref:Uncharacterized protein n=1 Tax=Aristolochia fimbriata TaxID=158543 RepID=A0AAV7EER0_ARIFI|nr:hypothetical protein H6P81_013450 [Aristolochia fimbriata]
MGNRKKCDDPGGPQSILLPHGQWDMKEKSSKKPPIKIEYKQGGASMNISQDFTRQWMEELAKCVVIKMINAGLKQDEIANVKRKTVKVWRPKERRVAGGNLPIAEKEKENFFEEDRESRLDLVQLEASNLDRIWQAMMGPLNVVGPSCVVGPSGFSSSGGEVEQIPIVGLITMGNQIQFQKEAKMACEGP